MSDELLSYYTNELAYLLELGSEFAAKYPKIASRLHLEGAKCDDPHVERLLEGVAFLAARVRHKLDDEFPEITDALLGVLYPDLQRPLPSLTIAQFVVGREQAKLKDGFTVPRGSRLNSRPVGGSPCSFRTSYDVTLWPVEVVSAQLEPERVVSPDKPPEAVALLQIGLRCTGGMPFGSISMQDLRLHLDGSGATPAELYESLMNDVCRVVVRGKVHGGRVESVVLPAGAIEPVGFGSDEGLVPYSNRSFLGYRLLQEYFAFPAKFFFVELRGLDCLASRGFGDSIDVLFFLTRPPRSITAVQSENFRLGCTPIVNLFTTVAEPIQLDQTRAEYRVVADVRRPSATEVFSIDEVTGTSSYLAEPVRYEPFFSARNSSEGGQRRAYWSASRHPSGRKDDLGTEVYLSFVDSGFSAKRPAAEVITVRATCSNRDLPWQLPFGGDQGDFELEGLAPLSQVRCLRRPTRPVRPPLGRDAHWPLIAHLSLNHLSLVDNEKGLDAFRKLLQIYDFVENDVTRQQIEGILSVSSRRVAARTGRKVGNAACQGIEVTVEFDESNYVGTGAFLLASVIDRFLGLYSSVNSFSRLVARTRQRKGILHRWPPRSGEQTLL